jgi:DNA replication and repair protein RecF
MMLVFMGHLRYSLGGEMIKLLKLTDFRNFKNKTLEFSDKITTIVGPNASGKTNILEALYLLSTAKSFKAKLEVEMIKYEQELSRINGVLPLGSPTAFPPANKRGAPSVVPPASRHPLSLELMLTRGENGWPKKKLLVNGVPKRTIDFAGNFKTVLFGPWDMDLVTESPSIRRKFLDNVLSQVDREYRRSTLSYEKGLRQRNRVLWQIREDPSIRFAHSGPDRLLFWNQLLIKNGDYISQKREEFIDYANNTNKYQFQMNTNFHLEYDKSVISEGRLEQYKEEEVAAATTLVGPHRDDFTFFEGKRNLASYGSRGEQRMGILWLKMAELNFIEQASRLRQDSGEVRPTLLLDDIFSELDHEHRDIVMILCKKQQTIITTADKHFLKGLGKVERIELKS